MKVLKIYDGVGRDYTIHVTKKGNKIELWITVHIDYDSFDGESPFEELGGLFLEIRKDILNNNLESLQILKKYCDGEDLSNFKPNLDLYEKLISILDENW